ncbi:hypothetical protein [Amorphus sp. 3PC139-8]|uniref:hypothetical protein n=1 Tax=Amorphus sp. 3PC139-8 TaxID=2735676 RepID=UPI00345D23C9
MKRLERSVKGLVLAAVMAVAVASGSAEVTAQGYEQQRMQTQQYRSQQGLQRSSDQLNQSLRQTQSDLNNRANTQGMQQRQQIENMQQQLQPSPLNGVKIE